MVSIDTSVFVAALIQTEKHHAECFSLALNEEVNFYSHGLAETFNSLTGSRLGFRVPTEIAMELIHHYAYKKFSITILTPDEIVHTLEEAESRGVRGGAIFDFLHLVAAKKAGVKKFYTLNVSHFKAFHRKGDPEILHP